jgi:hypothetical protein
VNRRLSGPSGWSLPFAMLLCKRNFSALADWDFHANALTPCNVPAGSLTAACEDREFR